MRAAASKQAVISNQALMNDSFKMFNEVLGDCEEELTEHLEAHERWADIARSRCGVDIYLFGFDYLSTCQLPITLPSLSKICTEH